MYNLNTSNRCYGITEKKRRCKRHNEMPQIFCNLHRNQNHESLKCFGNTNEGMRCHVMLSTGFTEYCMFHKTRENKIQCWIVETFNGCTFGIFISLERAEKMSMDIQKIYIDKCMSIRPIKTLYRRDNKLTKKISSLKIDALIDLINEFVGIGYVILATYVGNIQVVNIQIVNICPLDYTPCETQRKYFDCKYFIKLNTIFKVSDISTIANASNDKRVLKF